MWLITPIGFFSVVQKASDVSGGTLTIRARVRADLDALRDQFLPSLGEVNESKTNDYRFRAVAPRAEVASAMAAMVNALDYSNFKNQVAKVQGSSRAHLYHDVWDVLYRLQSEPQKYAPHAAPTPVKAAPPTSSSTVHPRKDDKGRVVSLKKPSQPSSLAAWQQAGQAACVVPDGPMPAEVNGLAVASWVDHPATSAAWLDLAQQQPIDEPEFKVPAGSKRAAGVVVREPDGRVWIVAPSNAFGGYLATFPKGTIESGMSPQATALVEALEESGLRVRLCQHLVDVKRTQSYTRYYLAERVGGHPADMGWETQAVMLVPQEQLPQWLNSSYDTPIIEALKHV